ncbi:hypothetical protein SDJN02_14532, partial [Cucurbita argyrosperma subsp. argyrosperma]
MAAEKEDFIVALLEGVLFGKHVEEIISLANEFLYPGVIQEVPPPYTVCMTISCHLECKVLNIPKAKATMPSCIREYKIGLAGMPIVSIWAIDMNRGSPTAVVHRELERIHVVPHFKMDYRRHLITPLQ